MTALKRPIAIYYEHPHWFDRLFAELPFRRPGCLGIEIHGFADRPRDRGALIVGEQLRGSHLSWRQRADPRAL